MGLLQLGVTLVHLPGSESFLLFAETCKGRCGPGTETRENPSSVVVNVMKNLLCVETHIHVYRPGECRREGWSMMDIPWT